MYLLDGKDAYLVEFIRGGVKQLANLSLAVGPHLKRVLHHRDHLWQGHVQGTLKLPESLECPPRQPWCVRSGRGKGRGEYWWREDRQKNEKWKEGNR